MLYSTLLGKSLRQPPSGASIPSHKFLTRGGFIDQLISGVYTYLPLGWRVHQKIESIIREEMDGLGAQEILMPALQKKEQWEETGRWKTIDPPLFKFKDRAGRELSLGPTHEEVVTDLARRFARTYKDLPFAVYQIQTKFRNEMRSTGGLLRVREFSMKDLYSFHESEEDLNRYYLGVVEAYKKIFTRMGIPPLVMGAHVGTIGGSESHEFALPCESGEDKALYCEHCGFAENAQKTGELKNCPQCSQTIFTVSCIELAHTFKLGTIYSEKMKAYFANKDGKKKPLWMGCYGIGLGRALAAIVESHFDEKGIIWPKGVAPFWVHLVSVLDGGKEKVAEGAGEVYEMLSKKGVEVLYDDRNISAGIKFADMDLIGIPLRVIVSDRTIRKGGVEISERSRKSTPVIVKKDGLAGKVKDYYSGK